MFLNYGLYVCIILENAHHRTTSTIFCNITQNTTPEENGHKIIHISSPIVLLLMAKVKDILEEIRIKFHLGRAKGSSKRGMQEEAQNKGYFCKMPIIKQDTNFISQTFGQTHF